MFVIHFVAFLWDDYGQHQITAITKQNGAEERDQDKIKTITETRKRKIKLYSIKIPKPTRVKQHERVSNVGSEEIPDITRDEMNPSLSHMKSNKALRKDTVITEIMK